MVAITSERVPEEVISNTKEPLENSGLYGRHYYRACS